MTALPAGARLAIACLLVVLAGAAPFAVDAGATAGADGGPEPVPFEDTVRIGLAAEERRGLEATGRTVPRVEVFYAQYRYVVGYEGVERAANALGDPANHERFGDPIAVFVSDFAGRDPEVAAEGGLRVERLPGWVEAGGAWYVVDSEARTGAGPTVVPFGEREAAEAFADDHGGDVVDWRTVRSRRFETDDADAVRERLAAQAREADRRVAAATSLERPVSVVVGRDAPTIAAAVAAAPANTTVRVPPGTYRERIAIERPITLAGAGPGSTVIDGGGEGSPVRLEADHTAVSGVSIVGVGDRTRDPGAAGDDKDAWDHNVELGYGHGDAGVRAVGVEDVLVADVRIETRANGVLLRDAPGAVVDRVRVEGTEAWRDGFMGVMAMRSPAVIQRSTFVGGRDGVYAHRSGGIVVRDSTMREARFGVHLMYTSDALIANNRMADHAFSGVIVMTDPSRNAIVGNDVRRTTIGISPGGSASYVARNVVVDADRGLTTGATASIYEHNALVRNDEGARATSIVPSSRVVANDFVDNDRPATATAGPLRVWAHGGRGNHWSGAIGTPTGPDGVLDRPYGPTDPVDRRLGRVDGARTLAASPAVRALSALRGTVPGLRTGSVVDPAPLASPANPDLVAAAERDPLGPSWSGGYWSPDGAGDETAAHGDEATEAAEVGAGGAEAGVGAGSGSGSGSGTGTGTGTPTTAGGGVTDRVG